MVEIETKYIAIGAIVLSMMIFVTILMLAPIGLSPVLQVFGAAFAAFCAVLSFVLWKWGYMLIPYVTSRLNIIEVHNGYELTPAQDAIVRRVGDTFYASVFLHIKMYKSVTERAEEETMSYVESFERAIAQIRFPVKISTLLFAKDVAKYREDIETKKYSAQLRLQREREKPEPDAITLDRLEKEVAMYEAQLMRIAAGERPLGLIAYAMTTGTGITKDAAVAVAKNQAAEIKTLLANALNVEVSYLYGEDMKKCFQLEYMIPPTTKEVEKFVEA